MRRGWVAGLVVIMGCAAHRAVTAPPPQALRPPTARRYVDPRLGFEISPPEKDWQMELPDEQTVEGVSIPVVMRHKATGAQVVLQVAPAVATPTQFAERLNNGLKSHAGFTASDPEPLPLSGDNAVGFRFTLGDTVQGRVAVRPGTNGHVLMMLATWPTGAPAEVSTSVDAIFGSVQPVPRG